MECDRSGRSYSVKGRDVDRFGDFSLIRPKAVGSLRCCDEPMNLDSRADAVEVSRDPPPFLFLLLPNNLPSAVLNVDFFR